jgi:hypothetical protein
MAAESNDASSTGATSSGADGGDLVSPAGLIFQKMTAALLAAEYTRRDKTEGRGANLVAAGSTFSALVFALIAVIIGKDAVFSNRVAVVLLGAALISFVVSAALGLFVQNAALRFWTVDRNDLGRITEDEFWGMSANEAVKHDIHQQVTTTITLRAINDQKANWATAGLAFQVAAVALLGDSIGLEMGGRILAAAMHHHHWLIRCH